MGEHPLDPEDEFWQDMEDVIFICVRKDKTVNLKSSVQNMDELRSIFTTAYMMALFHDAKSYPDGVDKLQ